MPDQTLPTDTDLAEALVPAAIEAGRAILEVRAGHVAVSHKADSSPVTEADRAAEAIILRHLAKIAPGVPVVAEEAVEAGRLPEVGRAFFLVDPLDGTKEFVKGGDDFTVNIALVRDDVPVVGIVLAPATGHALCRRRRPGRLDGRRAQPGRPAVDRGARARRRRSTSSPRSRTGRRRPTTTSPAIRSAISSRPARRLKFCLVAEGKADLYPRMGTTMQWDTAAGDAVLRAAGGTVEAVDGGALPYGPNGAEGVAAFRNPWFIASGKVPILSV